MEPEKLILFMKTFISSRFDSYPLVWIFQVRKFNKKMNRIYERDLRIACKGNASGFIGVSEVDNLVTVFQKNLQLLMAKICKQSVIEIIHW